MANFVLVPGGFVGGWYWGGVAQRLEKAGHRVDVVEQLPSAGPDPATLGDLAADPAAVTQCVERVGEPVVLVGHSYGGMVITELADHPGVAHSVYLAAFWPSRGRSVMDMFSGGPPPTWFAPDRGHPTTYIICEHDQALPPVVQEQMAAAADHVERLPSSHHPMVSLPDELAATLGRAH
jgi:pimeloyl-ACP methyl ester carboxylesterase